MLRTSVLLSVLATCAAFAPRSVSSPSAVARLAAAEQEVKDLDLEEMFEVFEAADSKVSAAEIPKGQLFVPKFDAKSAPGVAAPFGFFDPFALATDVTEAEFKKFRESELKHGRVAMLAFLGIVVAESGFNFFGDRITGPAIYQFQQADSVLNAFTFNVLGFIAAVEGFNIINGWDTPSETLKSESGIAGLKDTYANGDLKFDPMGLKPKNADALRVVQTKELNNGRLAMIATAGVVAQELVTGQSVF